MASTSEIARRYFAALAAHDLDAAAACWAPGAIDRFVGQVEVVGPGGVRKYFAELFAAFPDFKFEVLDLTTYRNRAAVRWRATATFAGPGLFQGFAPNGARFDIEGCDVVTVADELIAHNDAYLDTGDVIRQLGFLPAAGSAAEARLTKLANARTRIASRLHPSEAEHVADGVWVLRGGLPRVMNVYLIEDQGAVTVFDAGIKAMTSGVAAAAARLGGINRVVLGHADCDHRGSAPGLRAPVFCHPADRSAAQSDAPYREYWDFQKLDWFARPLMPKVLRGFDGGRVEISGTVDEGDDVAGFRVVHLPGHAPGQIGLFRDSDRLALSSDCFYTFDPQTGFKGDGAPRLPHEAFNIDTDQARDSIRKLAALDPAVVWAGHADPVRGDVVSQLERAASAPL